MRDTTDGRYTVEEVAKAMFYQRNFTLETRRLWDTDHWLRERWLEEAKYMLDLLQD